MSNASEPLGLHAALWATLRAMRADLRLYAIFDGARRSPDVYEAIQASRLPAEPLIGKQIATALLRVSPWLVELPRQSAHPRGLLERFYGQSACVFFCAPAELPMSRLALQLKRIVRVQVEGGDRYLFRYFDPRVLRAFLPTCSGSQWEQIRGAIEVFFAESEDPAVLIRFADDNGLPRGEEIPLTTSDPSDPSTSPDTHATRDGAVSCR